MLEEADQPVDANFVVLAQNRFVPLDQIPGCAATLRRFTRGAPLDASEQSVVKEYWAWLDAAQDQLAQRPVTEGPTPEVTEWARRQLEWPAVGLASSELELRALLTLQFEKITQARVPWQGVDSSTNYLPMRGGICVWIDWFWHGH